MKLQHSALFSSRQQIYTAQVLQDPYSEEGGSGTAEEGSNGSFLDAEINNEEMSEWGMASKRKQFLPYYRASC